jgi:PhnB protein
MSDESLGGITPYLTLADGHAAARFYAEVFGASETFTRPSDDGGVAHMTMSLNDGVLMLSDSARWGRWEHLPRTGGNAVGWLAIRTRDCDATYNAAIAAGATPEYPPEDTAWGDRYARFRDPFGQLWAVSSVKPK